MKQNQSFLLLITVIGILFLSGVSHAAIPASERAALIAFYNTCDGDNWIGKDGWKTAPLDSDGFGKSGTESNWYGVGVENDRVTSIILSYNNLKGNIPAVIGNLTNLKVLFLGSNQLSGSIPSQIGNLTQLDTINLFGNSLSGSIPSQIGNLSSLRILSLSQNSLSGGIPTQFQNLKKLEGLYLSANQLSGNIPGELGSLSSLISMDLSGNKLEGSIPSQLGSLSKLKILILANNQLSKSIPYQLGNLKEMEILRFEHNQLSGLIPSQFKNFTKLCYLYLSYNGLSGTIPADLKNLKNLLALDIGYNCLKATDPSLRAWLAQKSPNWEAHQDQCSLASSEISLNRSEMVFGASTNGTSTLPQTVYIENVGGGTLNWTASSTSSWISISPSTGTDSGEITVSVNPAGLTPGTYTGTVSFTAPQTTNSPKSLPVVLNIYAQGGTSAPYGDFATPVDGSTTYNSIPVTGWVLDDIGITSVKIYNDSTYIGDALFVEGARPDVQAAFPTAPNNHKAGWGYMLLTHFLPNGGNGQYNIIAKATDIEGNETVLGSKTITIDNSHAVKPFGAIDTPAQGGTASGSSYVNFGWALTPQPNKIPTDGSTINVVLDGVVVGHPGYNVQRSDIESLFPGYQNSTGAIGYFYLDTTTLSNGIHTIAWNVTDNAGNSDGIGSRYFSVLNSASTSSIASKASAVLTGLPQIERIPNRAEPVEVITGFDDSIPPSLIEPNDDGFIALYVKEIDRIRIHLEGTSAQVSDMYGFLKVGNELTPLPVGSTLDKQKGIFYWTPGPGFNGRYELVFIGKDGNGNFFQRNITVNILPK